MAAVAHGERVVLPAERKEVPVADTTLARYTGTYALTPTFHIVVTLEGSHLMAQATGQSKFPMFPESATTFFFRVVDAQVEFVTNAKGDATALVLHQNGHNTTGTKQ
jgi:Domain of unknown function (DUF3471)